MARRGAEPRVYSARARARARARRATACMAMAESLFAAEQDGGVIRVSPFDVLAIISFFYLCGKLARYLYYGPAPRKATKQQ